MSQLSYEPWYEYRNRVKRITFKQTTFASPVPSEVLFYSGDIRYFHIFSEINGNTVTPPVPPPNGGGSTGDGTSGNGDVQPPTEDGEGDRLRIILITTIVTFSGAFILYNAGYWWAQVMFPNAFRTLIGGVVAAAEPAGIAAASASGSRAISVAGESQRLLPNNANFTPTTTTEDSWIYAYLTVVGAVGNATFD